jgi:ABC-type sulfate transport system permease component
VPIRTEAVPLLIMTKLEEFDYQGATAIASVSAMVSGFWLFVGIPAFVLPPWTVRNLAAES